MKNEMETTSSGKASEYDKNFMKIKFDTHDDLPLNKTIKISNIDNTHPTCDVLATSYFGLI